MDQKELDEQLLALGQRMRERGEELYPEWTWILYPQDMDFRLFCLDMVGLKARLPNFDKETERVLSKQGIIILIGDDFLIGYLALPEDAQAMCINSVLHNAIKHAQHILPEMKYSTFIATTYGSERNPYNEYA